MTTEEFPTHDPGREETVASATRALADATAALTKVLGQQLGAVSEDVGRAVTEGLREASRGLDTASESLARGGQRADRRRERAEETRAELLEAAAGVIAERGYEGASVGDLATAAGYTKGAIYSNFGSKEDLFLALAERELDAGRVAPRPGDPAPSRTQALLALEILAAMARHPEQRAALAAALDRALRVATGTAADQPLPADAVDRAVIGLAVTLVGPLMEAADASTVGVTARLTARLSDAF